jgi:hypothetical protein
MEWIEARTQRFLRKDYGRTEIEAEFGAIQSGTNPNLLQLAPKDARFERAELVMAEVGGERQPNALHIQLRDMPAIDFQRLIKRYGSPQEVPRLHPTQPVPFAFDVRGTDFQGRLLLGFAPEPLKAGKHVLRDIRIVRIAN